MHDKHIDYDKYIEFRDFFKVHIREESEKSETYKFWATYIDIVELLLTFIRATRTFDWTLHVHTLREMLPWLFAYDRINYHIL